MRRDEAGILSYTVAVRSLDGVAGQRRGVQVEMDESLRVNRPTETIMVTVRNTGTGTDLLRLSTAIDDQTWTATLANALAVVPGGQTVTIPVRIAVSPSATRPAHLTFTAVSENDPSRTSTVTAALTAAR